MLMTSLQKVLWIFPENKTFLSTFKTHLKIFSGDRTCLRNCFLDLC